MRLQVVDGGEGEIVDAGDGLAGEEAHDQAADQAGPGRGGDGREVGEAQAGLAHRTLDQAVELLDMRPCCYLGHHTAIGRMLLELRQQGGGQHRAVAADEGHGRLVATRLDAEDDAVAVDHQPPPRQRYPAQMGLRLPLRIGTRGSPLALAQATLVREGAGGSLAGTGRAGCDRGRGHQDHRRSRHRPAAGRHRRQGAVHQGDRGGAAGRHHRSRGALDEGHADLAARGAGHGGHAAPGRPTRRADRATGCGASPSFHTGRSWARRRSGVRPSSWPPGPTCG